MISNSSILDLLGNHTGASSSPGRVTKETLEKEEETGETQVKNMTIGTYRKGTTLGTTWRGRETSQGNTREKTTTVTDQGVSRDPDIEKHLEIDRGKGDREKEARAPEDRGREVTAPEVVGGEVMTTGEVILAMGAEVEKVARRP